MRRMLYPDYDLIVHDASDVVSVDECYAAIAKLYEMASPPRDSVWYFGDALSDASMQEIDDVQSRAALLVRGRGDGRTAIIASRDSTYGRLRQYLAFARAEDLPLDQHLFRSMNEAMGWLGIDYAALMASPHIDLDEPCSRTPA